MSAGNRAMRLPGIEVTNVSGTCFWLSTLRTSTKVALRAIPSRGTEEWRRNLDVQSQRAIWPDRSAG